MSETIEEIRREIQAAFDATGEDIGLFHDEIFPAVRKLEKYFRESNNIEALEDQVQILNMMGDPIYRAIYLSDEYVICKRILDIDSQKEAVRHQIEDHIIADLARNEDEGELRVRLEEYYEKNKAENYAHFLEG